MHINIGSRDETKETNGMANFAEKLLITVSMTHKENFFSTAGLEIMGARETGINGQAPRILDLGANRAPRKKCKV